MCGEHKFASCLGSSAYWTNGRQGDSRSQLKKSVPTDDSMQGGKAAAETILDMRATGDFSKFSCQNYEKRWMNAFGYDFNNVST